MLVSMGLREAKRSFWDMGSFSIKWRKTALHLFMALPTLKVYNP
jgi:hypothetical protein